MEAFAEYTLARVAELSAGCPVTSVTAPCLTACPVSERVGR